MHMVTHMICWALAVTMASNAFAMKLPAAGLPGPAGPQITRSAGCAPANIMVDVSLADSASWIGTFDGEATGETFQAADTLIGAIAVWRIAVEATDAAPMKLWIVEVDSVGAPLTDRVVFDGPSISYPYGDGVSPTEIQYSFDPPISLPHRGPFFFAIQELCYGYFGLLAANSNPYLGGSAWRTGRSYLSGCGLRPYPDLLLDVDLVFKIEFCHDTTTAVNRPSWGRLKTIYR